MAKQFLRLQFLGSLTPDYGPLGLNGTFPAFKGDYARKSGLRNELF